MKLKSNEVLMNSSIWD